MARARFGFKVFGICLLATLGITAFTAVGAQGSWLVGGGTLSGEKAIKVKAHTERVFSIPALLLEILCMETSAGAGSKINSSPEPYILLLLNFTNCQTVSAHKVAPGCKPAEPLVWKMQGSLQGSLLLLVPDDNNTPPRFVRADFPAATCALPDTNITGAMTFECLTQSLSSTGDCSDHEASHLVQEIGNHGLFYGGNPATLSGVMNLELVSGESWSGH